MGRWFTPSAQREGPGLPAFGGHDPHVRRISPDDLAWFLVSDQFLLTSSGSPRKPITVNRAKSGRRSFFGFRLESGWIRENSARLSRLARTAAKEPATLTEAEIGCLRQALSDRTETPVRRGGLACRFDFAHRKRGRLIFELLLGTSIRLGSLVALNRGDVDLKSGTLHIRTKGGGEERVFLNPQPVRLLGRFLKESAPEANCGPDTPLFRSRWGTRLCPRPIQLRFAALCRKAGIARPISIHSLRHSW
ncbi:MAG: tyrosine-type recombinase/integrase [Candidatus Zixiibacteriota bacterium]